MKKSNQEAISRGMKMWWARRRKQEALERQMDGIGSYTLALRMMALAIGSRRFETLPEMYWQERHGVIP